MFSLVTLKTLEDALAKEEITGAMVEAGVAALDFCRDAFSEEETVRAVYSAMARARVCEPKGKLPLPHEEG